MAFVPEAALIALREGLEVFLIVGVLLGLVHKLGRSDAKKWILLGAAAGLVASLAVGLLVQLLLLERFEEGGGGAWFELVAALAAVGVLTYMVFWMWKHTRGLMAGLRKQVESALDRNTLWVLAFLTFASVVREGLEVVLFYGALSQRSAAFDLAWSGLVGAIASLGLVVLILGTSVRFDLSRFFAVTGILLVFIAGGLLVHSVHAAMDLGLLPHGNALWDTSGFIPDDRADGRILHALVGYTAAPNLLQAVLYFGYVLGVGTTYLASLGVFHRRTTGGLRRGRVAATVAVALLALSGTVWGAANPVPDRHTAHGLGHGTAHDEALGPAVDRVKSFSGRLGILLRDHGEMIHYNASTYESFKQFIRDIWPYTGLPAELLTVDDGTYYIDEAHPFDEEPRLDARLVDAWVQPWDKPAVPAADPTGQGLLSRLRVEGHYYVTPNAGPGYRAQPGQGEPDVLEILGLGAYRDWIKMSNASPRYQEGLSIQGYIAYHLGKHFGEKVVVAFAHGIDPKVNATETVEAAAHRLAAAKVDVVFDVYQSSIHSDAMNTCMMEPHARHALRHAGFRDEQVRSVAMAGHHTAWGNATAGVVERTLANVHPDLRVSVHLVHHGAAPDSKKPCPRPSDPAQSAAWRATEADQYHANARRQFELALPAVARALENRSNAPIVRQVYGQGADAADDGVLSPREALDLDHAAGVQYAVLVPYEVWGNGLDTLVYLRESLGFTPDRAPYYDASKETRFVERGMTVHVVDAHLGWQGKADALLYQIGDALARLEGSA